MIRSSVYLNGVNCKGDERNIIACKNLGWDQYQRGTCSRHGRDAAVQCFREGQSWKKWDLEFRINILFHLWILNGSVRVWFSRLSWSKLIDCIPEIPSSPGHTQRIHLIYLQLQSNFPAFSVHQKQCSTIQSLSKSTVFLTQTQLKNFTSKWSKLIIL